jgi:hypothetical protein
MFYQWLSEVFSSPDPVKLLGIAGRTAVIYLLVVIAMRLLGTRPLGRMSVYDFIRSEVYSPQPAHASTAAAPHERPTSAPAG